MPETKHEGVTPNPTRKLLKAARNMDWMQVVLNQGPPCFHLEKDGKFCGRAERWHDKTATQMFHGFVSLADLLEEK